MDSLALLSEYLPNARLESSEREMSNDFKAAAQSLAALYKSSKQTVKHAHDAGYADCLRDILQFIQTGLSTASEEDDAMGVARVMDWVEGQLDRFREGVDFERRTNTTGENTTIVPAPVSHPPRSLSPPRGSVQTSPASPTIRRPHAVSLAAEPVVTDPTPVPAVFPAPDVPSAAKRRHAAVASIDPSLARRRSRVFVTPIAPGPSDSRLPQRRRRGPERERERVSPADSRSTDHMDVEEDGPRDRKRFRTSRNDPPSSA